MSTIALTPPSEFGTAVEIPLLSAEEFVSRYDGQPVELAKGIVEELEMPMSGLHGKACARMTVQLTNYADRMNSGHVISNDTWIRTIRSPDSVRGPDVFFVSYARQPKGSLTDGMIEATPELVVEVRSPSDPWSKVLTKTLEYLDSKVSVVVILDPATKSAIIYRDNEPPKTYSTEQVLTVPDILPGFSVNVGSLFE
jgi:Uma2 family endonuclease